MRIVILATSFLALSPFAYAQSNTGAMDGVCSWHRRNHGRDELTLVVPEQTRMLP